jgi:dihydroorotase
MTVTRFYNAHIIEPSQAIDGIGYLDITDSHISAVSLGQPATDATCDKKIDCKQAVLAPGLVDMRVQSADPGAEHLESLASLTGRCRQRWYHRAGLLAKHPTGD